MFEIEFNGKDTKKIIVKGDSELFLDCLFNHVKVNNDTFNHILRVSKRFNEREPVRAILIINEDGPEITF